MLLNHCCKNIRSALENLVQNNPKYKGKDRLTPYKRGKITADIRVAIKNRSKESDKKMAAKIVLITCLVFMLTAVLISAPVFLPTVQTLQIV